MKYKLYVWGVLAPASMHGRPSARPSMNLSEIFRNMFLQSNLRISPQIIQQPIFPFVGIKEYFWLGCPQMYFSHWNPNIFIT